MFHTLTSQALSSQALQASSPAASLMLSLARGGAATKAVSTAAVATTASAMSPEIKSVLFMAIAMAFHYLGYSLARPATVALFTSKSTGYQGFHAAFPFAMAFVSPLSLVLLVAYGGVLDRHGPRGALVRSTLFCSLTVGLAAAGIYLSEKFGWQLWGIATVKFITGPLFVFRESYVQLLTSQFWSYFASILNPDQSATLFGPIAGLTSITSALSGFSVSPIVKRVGLEGALVGTSLTLLLSLAAASAAYNIAERHGFEPKDHQKKHTTSVKKNKADEPGLITKATQLFRRVPVLGALFVELLASQGLATVLNVIFVARLSMSIPDDTQRAGYVGVFFSVVNLCTMLLQFAIMPPLMHHVEPKIMWRLVPLICCLVTTFQAIQVDPTLAIVTASLGVMKITEYSARRMLDEMIFVPLDFESRFVGKEVIGVFGYRFGKSLMSLGLSVLTAVMGSDFGLQQRSVLSGIVAYLWLGSAWRLSNLVPTRAEAQSAHARNRRKS